MRTGVEIHLLAAVFAVASWWFVATVSGEVFAECDGVPAGTFTGSSKSCRIYIYCDGDESFEGFCQDDGYFDAAEGVCDDRDKVDCRIGEEAGGPGDTTLTPPAVASTSTPTPTTSTTTATTTTASPPTSSTPTTPTAMAPESVGPSNGASTVTALQTPASTASTTTETTTVVTNTSASTGTATVTSCPIVDDPLQIAFVANPSSCSEYYMCIRGVPLEMYCSEMLHFNVQTGKCDYPENAECQADYTRPKEQCRRHIVDFYPHTSNCNYFYRCQNGFLMLQQCPLSFGWDVEKRNCIALSKAKCFNPTLL